jgi:hypothetical protein
VPANGESHSWVTRDDMHQVHDAVTGGVSGQSRQIAPRRQAPTILWVFGRKLLRYSVRRLAQGGPQRKRHRHFLCTSGSTKVLARILRQGFKQVKDAALMSEPHPAPFGDLSGAAPLHRLDSWKAIVEYLGRRVTAVQR